jgi:phosphate transport system permease protein
MPEMEIDITTNLPGVKSGAKYKIKKPGIISRNADKLFILLTATCGAVLVLLMAGIFMALIGKSMPAIIKFGAGFITSQEWNPVTQNFGALSSIYGTLLSTFIALMIAVPLSIVIALFLVELAPPFISKPVGQAIELLAAIPSIIYGMWGLFVFAPWLAEHFMAPVTEKFGSIPLFEGPPMGIGMFTAGIILALMILPFISAVIRDVFAMVPGVVKEAGFGMGGTTWEVTHQITIPYGLQGIIGAVFLGLGRAIGETMAVTFVIGNSHSISASLFHPGNSIASTLANEFTEASDPIYLSALVELGLILFAITFAIQTVSQFWLGLIKKKNGGNL